MVGKMGTDRLPPPGQSQEETFQWRQLHSTFPLGFVKGKRRIKMKRKPINDDS